MGELYYSAFVVYVHRTTICCVLCFDKKDNQKRCEAQQLVYLMHVYEMSFTQIFPFSIVLDSNIKRHCPGKWMVFQAYYYYDSLVIIVSTANNFVKLFFTIFHSRCSSHHPSQKLISHKNDCHVPYCYRYNNHTHDSTLSPYILYE